MPDHHAFAVRRLADVNALRVVPVRTRPDRPARTEQAKCRRAGDPGHVHEARVFREHEPRTREHRERLTRCRASYQVQEITAQAGLQHFRLARDRWEP